MSTLKKAADTFEALQLGDEIVFRGEKLKLVFVSPGKRRLTFAPSDPKIKVPTPETSHTHREVVRSDGSKVRARVFP